MNSFSTRALRGHGTLGERLKKIREDREEGLETVAEKLQIQQKYLAALESGEYLKLPGDVYVRNFLKRYAGHLDVNPVTVVHLYEREMGVFEPQQKQKIRSAIWTPESGEPSGMIDLQGGQR